MKRDFASRRKNLLAFLRISRRECVPINSRPRWFDDVTNFPVRGGRFRGGLPGYYRQNDVRRVGWRVVDYLSGGLKARVLADGRAGIGIAVKAREIAA